MHVILLGTGSPVPTPDRAGPATLVRTGAADLLFDCGRGVLLRLAAAGSAPQRLHTVFLTHLHSDHLTDLNDVITTRWALSPVPLPLRVVGPEGTAQLVDRTLAMLEDDIGYRLAHHADLVAPPDVQVQEVAVSGPAPVVVVDQDGFRVLAAPTDHAPAHPTLGYRVESAASTAVIAGDTLPCAGLDALCQGADVYVQTVVRRALIEGVPFARLQDVLDYHSSIGDAAATAERAGVGALVMTHPVPPPAPGTEQEWIDEAAAIFGGDVRLGADLLSVPC